MSKASIRQVRSLSQILRMARDHWMEANEVSKASTPGL